MKVRRTGECDEHSDRATAHGAGESGAESLQARLENLLEQASKKEPSYADFLDQLLSCEVQSRRTRYLRAKLQLAHLPFVKTFEQFDFSFQPSIGE